MGLKIFSIVCFVAAASLTVFTSISVMSRGENSKDFPNSSDPARKLQREMSQDNLLSSQNVSSFITNEQQIRGKCLNNSQKSFYNNYLAVRNKAEGCLREILNFTDMLREIEERNKPGGELQEMFGKYCKKSPIFKDCMLNFTTGQGPCLLESDKASKKTVQILTDASLDFICHKDGDYIALFIAEGGPACISAKEEAIKSCMDSSFRSSTPLNSKEGPLVSSVKLGPKECQDVFKFQKCVAKELETCPDPTPANLVDSLIDHVFERTPCRCLNPKRRKRRTGC